MSAARTPTPWAHLLIDHGLIRSLLLAMEEEARRLYDGKALRASFWESTLELIDGFIEGCHRQVEEQVIFPKLIEHGDDHCRQVVSKLSEDHGRAHALTNSLCEGIRSGDWEGVLRMAMIYVSGLRKHFEAEEQAFEELGELHLPGPVLRQMRTEAEALEAAAMRGNGPGQFVDLTRQLCEATDIPEHLRPGGVTGSLGRHRGPHDRQLL